MLRAYGAEVVITPTAVEHDSPESYYSVSSRLAEEIPGGFKPDQYSNMANPEAHYLTTGPEIWEQTGGEIDAIVISVGTGGTISGVGRYFKERRPEVRIVGVDPEGSIYTARSESTSIRTSSRGSARTRGRRPWIPRSSTNGSASRTATRSSRPPPGAGGGPPRRRLVRDDGRGRARNRGAARAGRAGADDPPRLGPLVPLEVPRRQLDARARVPRADGAGADGRASSCARRPGRRRRSSRSPRTRRSPRRST